MLWFGRFSAILVRPAAGSPRQYYPQCGHGASRNRSTGIKTRPRADWPRRMPRWLQAPVSRLKEPVSDHFLTRLRTSGQSHPLLHDRLFPLVGEQFAQAVGPHQGLTLAGAEFCIVLAARAGILGQLPAQFGALVELRQRRLQAFLQSAELRHERAVGREHVADVTYVLSETAGLFPSQRAAAFRTGDRDWSVEAVSAF